MAEERARKADLDRALDRLECLEYRFWNGTDPERLDAGKLALLERDKAVETKLRKNFRKLADGFEWMLKRSKLRSSASWNA